MTILLVDMDGVTADLEGAFARTMADTHPQWAIPVSDRNGFGIVEDHTRRHGPDAGEAARNILNAPGFYRTLPAIPGAIEAMNDLIEMGIDVRICSSPSLHNPTCASDKLHWVNEHHGPDWQQRLILTRDKSYVTGDYLIDDKPEPVCQRQPSWTQILYDTVYNRHTPGPRLSTWANWRHDLHWLINPNT